MSTYFPEDDTADDLAPSSGTRGAKGPSIAKCEDAPPISLPPFSEYTTRKVIDAKLKQGAQLVAIRLAWKTKKNGKVKLSMPELSEQTGYDRKTLGRIMGKIVESGLLTRKRTRDGYVYTWTRLAYNVAEVGPTLDMGD